ncbi:hypothetical protein [Haloplanus salilacus]|uniref:hypothetical protein n=1 Tax=Haloplanus salilacus TaxID=2949994 RepID=UPI0030D5EB7A
MVTVPASTLAPFERFSRYNSPYTAHDHGRAIDLYPTGERGPSPVAGEVVDTRTVRAPSRSYAADHDHLILIDTGERVARILHVDPAVEAGDRVAVGDDLGALVRSGFFAPWVDGHVHLGFRTPDANPYRAAGSLPVEVAVDPRPIPWDGSGVVREVGETYVVLDEPSHPNPGSWAGLAGASGVVLDGGCPHYDGGGVLPTTDGERQPVSVAGTRVGVAEGRDVTWDAVTPRANGRPVTGLSLFVARDATFGAKVVCPDHDFAVGDRIELSIRWS